MNYKLVSDKYIGLYLNHSSSLRSSLHNTGKKT